MCCMPQCQGHDMTWPTFHEASCSCANTLLRCHLLHIRFVVYRQPHSPRFCIECRSFSRLCRTGTAVMAYFPKPIGIHCTGQGCIGDGCVGAFWLPSTTLPSPALLTISLSPIRSTVDTVVPSFLSPFNRVLLFFCGTSLCLMAPHFAHWISSS